MRMPRKYSQFNGKSQKGKNKHRKLQYVNNIEIIKYKETDN